MASRVSVGKTSPVPLGQQPATNSLPVVFAEDQPPIPVEEQNLIKSEVALSLLGIPRSEVALGIFADVNTYDVNPTEWAQFPLENTPADIGGIESGVEHIPDEAGARLVAPDVSTTVLTSKRFFRYQPGRVSSSTMGVKMNTTEDPYVITDAAKAAKMKGAPSLKKWGIFDKFDGYYFEIANGGQRNDFRCVRRTQAVIPSEPAGYSGALSWFNNGGSSIQNPLFNQNTNFGIAGVDPVIIRDGLVYTAAAIYDPSLVYSPASVAAIDVSSDPSGALKNYQPEPGYAVRLATYNGTSWSEVMDTRVHQFPFDQSTTIPITPKNTSLDRGYIRLDAHCNFYKIISNLNRKNIIENNEVVAYNGFPGAKDGLESSQWGIAGSSISSYNQTIIDNTWDTVPSDINREKKVWHLLVNTQGSARISNAQFQNCASIPSNVKIARHSSTGTGTKLVNGNVTLKEWFNICVPKPFRMVYEWRPVRAMFSGDKLDGIESIVRQSDINTAATDTIIGGGAGGAINRPGEIIETPEGESLTSQSAYNIDFTKVTMWKIEFSWYGAVGAIFLCYVPVSNGEARWVRVHHIRASNQHSVASLGNATLPITYLTHGGVESGLETTDIGNTLVKYGASYYIDGGDKGTVRLLSKASDFQREVPQGFYDFAPNTWGRASASKITYDVTDHPNLSGDVAVGLIGAYLNEDSTAKVKWITQSGDDITLHLSNSSLPASNASGVRLIIPRASRSLLTVRAKDFIRNRDGQPVRNRLQIYPIKYGAGITGGQPGELLTLKAVKNPLFIVTNTNTNLGTSVVASGSTIVRNPANTANSFVNTKNSTLPVEVGFATPPVLANGKYRYGYFLATTDQSTAATGWTEGTSDPALYTPVLGKLYRENNKYYFEKYESYPEDIYIVGLFVPERHLTINAQGLLAEIILNQYTSDGGAKNSNNTYIGILGSTGSSDQTKWDRLQFETLSPGSTATNITTANAPRLTVWEDITRLSGVRVGQDLALTPIASTGVEILSYYATQGGYQFDLESYFAYNKEYLSFPLTDEVDIINFFGHYDISALPIGDISATSIVSGKTYIITSPGNTNFTLIGSSNNNPGTVFTATGAGTGTGFVSLAVPFKVNNALTWEEQ
jgi:hypothetical protein